MPASLGESVSLIAFHLPVRVQCHLQLNKSFLQKPQKLRHILSQYGDIGRLYLAPEGWVPCFSCHSAAAPVSATRPLYENPHLAAFCCRSWPEETQEEAQTKHWEELL